MNDHQAMRFYMWAAICLISFPTSAGDDDYLRKQYDFYQSVKGGFEGYHSSDCPNTISYHSLRNDIRDGLITRASNGSMGIEWTTQAIPGNFQGDGAWFVWLAAIDLTNEEAAFDVFIDGVKRFTLQSSQEENVYLTHPDGGILKYQSFHIDQNGDSQGYMGLYAPGSWLQSGHPVSIKILGEAAGQHTWIIVYKADDAMDYLEKSTEYQIWLNVSIEEKGDQYHMELRAPDYLAGKELSYAWAGKKGSVVLAAGDGVSMAGIHLEGDMGNQGFMVSDEYGELIYLPEIEQDTVISQLLTKAVLVNELLVRKGQISVKCRRIYQPKTVQSLLALSRSKLSQGKIFLMNSSHQDIAWMDSPEKCILERDTMLITPLIEQATMDPDYRFDIEDALMIKEYVERHPDRRESIQQLFNEGKISCGASYSQPYEEMYSGEALVRQFYFGRKWLKDEFNYDANTYWNVDVPGRTLQMPQIAKKSGVKNIMISRHEKGFFNWFSPDGSFVTAYSSGHYAESFTALNTGFYEAAEYIAKKAMDWEKYFPQASPGTVVPLLSDWDMSPAKDYSHLIKQWASISELTDQHGIKTEISLPRIKVVTTPELFRSFKAAADPLPSITGERPALWLYIHGPSHQKALKAGREGDILLTMAEKFATVEALTEGSFSRYPNERLHSAWESKIYPDHGWGGKEGQITDDLFRRKYEFARSEASQVLENATRSLASRVKTSPQKGIPVVVFNSLNWERTDLVSFQAGFDKGEARSLVIEDAGGNAMPVQYRVEKEYGDGSIRLATVYFVATGVPSVGYKTFYLSASNEDRKTGTGPSAENPFYKIEFGKGGLKSIYDKALVKELVDAEKFEAGEVFTMQSVGNGAGEFDQIQQPNMEGFARSGDDPAGWNPAGSGDVFTAWTRRSKLPYATVEQKIILYHGIKRIDFKISLLNWEGVLYREFRMAMPLNMENGQVAYEVPFGVVEVGKDEMEGAAGERYLVPAKDLRPRGIENWIGASDESFGATLSSSVAVADYVDPTDVPVPGIILQPLLLASRRSCHWEGNEYLQTGNHHFSFSLSSHHPGWIHGYKSGRQANEPLYAVVGPKQYSDARLPEEKSFFSLDADDVIISTIKKAEDDESVVVRMFDLKGEDRNLRLNHDFTFRKGVLSNLIEEDIQALETKKKNTEIMIGRHAIETIKLK
jgi:alpha-mannosidase